MFKVKFADIGEGLTEGKVTEVYVKTGDMVKEGDSLFGVETDKVTSDIPSPVSGKISKMLIKNDQEIKVGDVVIEIDGGSSASDAKVTKKEEKEDNASVVGSTPVSNDMLPSRPLSKTAPAATTIKSEARKDIEASYDVIVVGAGIGGYISAIKCSQLGLNTLIIEKEYYGGVCLNVGCIPTKALLKTAKIYDEVINTAARVGIDVGDTKKILVNWDKALARKNEVVKKLTSGVKSLLDKNKITQIIGTAKALDKNTIEVNGKKYHTENLIIATGSVPISLPLPGFKEAKKSKFLMDSTDILSIKKIPKALTVIGGGVIGVEFSSLFASLGAKVTIVQGASTVLELLDKDVINVMTKELVSKYKINIITDAMVKKIEGKSVFYEKDGKMESVKSDCVLESIGRKTVLTGFEDLGLELSKQKGIISNEYGETNIDGVYSIGDVVGKIMLAQVAMHAGVVTANRIAKKYNKPGAEDMILDYLKVPSCIYTNPEVAAIGKTEEQLKAESVEYKAFKFPFAAIGKALADDATVGFVKIIIEPKYKRILGAHIVGHRATEMISEITTLIECEGTISELARSIHPHPTMSEAIGEVAEALETGKALNL